MLTRGAQCRNARRKKNAESPMPEVFFVRFCFVLRLPARHLALRHGFLCFCNQTTKLEVYWLKSRHILSASAS
jgi:hypothetical protein